MQQDELFSRILPIAQRVSKEYANDLAVDIWLLLTTHNYQIKNFDSYVYIMARRILYSQYKKRGRLMHSTELQIACELDFPLEVLKYITPILEGYCNDLLDAVRYVCPEISGNKNACYQRVKWIREKIKDRNSIFSEYEIGDVE